MFSNAPEHYTKCLYDRATIRAYSARCFVFRVSRFFFFFFWPEVRKPTRVKYNKRKIYFSLVIFDPSRLSY